LNPEEQKISPVLPKFSLVRKFW